MVRQMEVERLGQLRRDLGAVQVRLMKVGQHSGLVPVLVQILLDQNNLDQ
jgi:hypothetical protein